MADRAQGRGRGRGGGGQFDVPRGGRGGGGRGDSLPFRGGPNHPQDRGRGDFGRGRGGGGGNGGRGAPVAVEVYSQGSGNAPTPDAKVQKIENDTINPSSTKAKPTSLRFPQRPGYATQGREIVLWANFMEMFSRGDALIHRYNIQIPVKKDQKAPTGKKLKRVITLLIEEHLTQHRRSIATDYKANLLCTSPLSTNEPYAVPYRQEEDDPGSEKDTYLVQLQPAGTTTISQLTDYLTSSQIGMILTNKDEIIQTLNIILGQYPKAVQAYTSVGSNKHFDTSSPNREMFNLGAGLEAFRGYFVSVRAATARLLVNVQVKHGAFYNSGLLRGLIDANLRESGPSMIKLEGFLKKLRIEVTHIVRKNRAGVTVPRIKNIDSLASPRDGRDLDHPPIVPRPGAGPHEVQFFVAETEGAGESSPTKSKKGKKPVRAGPKAAPGGYISVKQFFQNTYNISTANDMPVVNTGSRQNPSYLPVEVCMVVPNQPYNHQLTPTQTQQMIRFAVRRPHQNAQSIMSRGTRAMGIGDSANEIMSQFSLSIERRLVTVQGRVLPPSSVLYGKTSASIKFGSWNMQAALQFSTKATLVSWTYLWISTQGKRDAWASEDRLKETMNEFQAKIRGLGINAANYGQGLHVTFNENDVEGQIDKTIARFFTHKTNKPPQMLLVILPAVDDTIYNRIKYACDIERGIINVCVIGSKFAKERNDQYFANVALKVNLKLGGGNQFLPSDKLGIVAEAKTMLLGYDVTHPSPGSAATAPSVAGMVASIDRWLGQWPAEFRVQKAKQEMVSNLDSMLKNRLQLWKQKNGGRLPENMIFYRDGVSEGQYHIVLDNELPLLRKACKEVYPATDTKKGLPRISIIVVGKRHNVRFYPTKMSDADRSGNTPNGTVVDRGVTESRYWDFYLQAHTALQGTARPAHYFVVLDEIFGPRRKPQPGRNASDDLIDLTHNLCYMFGRATKAVSICPPAYYADLVCDRVRCYMSKQYNATPTGSVATSTTRTGTAQLVKPDDMQIHPNVRDTMFYI